MAASMVEVPMAPTVGSEKSQEALSTVTDCSTWYGAAPAPNAWTPVGFDTENDSHTFNDFGRTHLYQSTGASDDSLHHHPYHDQAPGLNAPDTQTRISVTLNHPTPGNSANLVMLTEPTISPYQTTLDTADLSPTDSIFYYDGFPRETNRSQALNSSSASHSRSSHSNPRTSSTMANFSPPKRQRRRRSEYAEPGSARAIYLEKNRRAATKCRHKQKQHEEHLVGHARRVEQTNKILKAEVGLLQAGMRELRMLIGQHSECADTRLKLYIQREANRLVLGFGDEENSKQKGASIKTEREDL